MSTQLQGENINTQGTGGAIDSLWGLTTATASGTYLTVVLAVAASMTAVNTSINTFVNQMGVLMNQAGALMRQMNDESNEDVSTKDEYTSLTAQSGVNQLSTQLISNDATELSTYISSDSQLLSTEKAVGDSAIKMYDQTTETK